MRFERISHGKIVVSLLDDEKRALALFLKIGRSFGEAPGRYAWFPDVWLDAAPPITINLLERLVGQGADVPFIPDEIDLMIGMARKYIRYDVDVSALTLWSDPREEIGNAFTRIWDDAHDHRDKTGETFELGPPRLPKSARERMSLQPSAEVWRARSQ